MHTSGTAVVVRVPAVGRRIYVDDMLYMRAGKADRVGGWAIVDSVHERTMGGEKVHFVTVQEFPGVEMNWDQTLAPKQRDFWRNFRNQHAHSAPTS